VTPPRSRRGLSTSRKRRGAKGHCARAALLAASGGASCRPTRALVDNKELNNSLARGKFRET